MDDYFTHTFDGHKFEVLVYEMNGTGVKTPLLAESAILAQVDPVFAIDNYNKHKKD